MNFSQYPDTLAVDIATSDEIHITDLTPNTDNQAEYLGVQLFKYGAVDTSINMYVKAYTTGDVLIATSSPISVSDIPSDTNYFYGWFNFNFTPRMTMDASTPIRFNLYLPSYTFSESAWIGAIHDWPTKMGLSTSTQVDESPISIYLSGRV